MRFCDKLPKERKNNNLSQEQLADKLGVSRQAVSKWESGSSYPDMEKIMQMCKILNCTLEDLMDDGVIKETTHHKFSLQEFLSFITRSYNMFCSMNFKEKIIFLFEMLFIAGLTSICLLITYSTLTYITHILLNIIPSYNIKYFLINIFDNIYLIGLIIISVITILHLYKIRYLDYYITIEDANVNEKTIEEPIDKKYMEKKKEVVIIRDPKHSTFNFFNVLAKLFLLLFKCFICFLLFLLAITFIFLVFVFILSLYHTIYGILFLWISIGVLGALLINYIFLESGYNFILNKKQHVRRYFIIFISGLLALGIGLGLFFATILSFKHVVNNDGIKINVSEEKITLDNKASFCDYFDSEYIIDDNMNDKIKIEITTVDGMNYKLHSYDVNGITNYYLTFYDLNEFDTYKLVMQDLKNKTLRDYNFKKIKITLSQESYDILKNNDEC